MAGDTPGFDSVLQPDDEDMGMQNNDNMIFSAQRSEDYGLSFIYSGNQKVRKLQMVSRDNKASMFKNYSSSLIDATDERRNKDKRKTLHRKCIPTVVISSPSISHEYEVGDTDVNVPQEDSLLPEASHAVLLVDSGGRMVDGMVEDGDSSEDEATEGSEEAIEDTAGRGRDVAVAVADNSIFAAVTCDRGNASPTVMPSKVVHEKASTFASKKKVCIHGKTDFGHACTTVESSPDYMIDGTANHIQRHASKNKG